MVFRETMLRAELLLTGLSGISMSALIAMQTRYERTPQPIGANRTFLHLPFAQRGVLDSTVRPVITEHSDAK